MGKDRDLQTRAEQEADKIGAQFIHSTDVIGDMSRAYHVDFSDIQIHSDEAAEQKVRAAGKDGLAQGNHLFFGHGIFESNAPEDKFLVGHELAHTMQQGVTDGGMGVSEHVPMGMAQYSKRIQSGSFQSDMLRRMQEESEEYDFEETGNENDGGEFILDPQMLQDEELQEKWDLQVMQEEESIEIHHVMTNKSSKYTRFFIGFAEKYGLDLDEEWNTIRMVHRGSHPEEYHEWVYEEVLYIDSIAEQQETEEKKRDKFLELFIIYVRDVVENNPQMLNKEFWIEHPQGSE